MSINNSIDIVFNDKRDIEFLGKNIFGHDFIHDFNSAKFAARLAKISGEIDKLLEKPKEQIEEEEFKEEEAENEAALEDEKIRREAKAEAKEEAEAETEAEAEAEAKAEAEAEAKAEKLVTREEEEITKRVPVQLERVEVTREEEEAAEEKKKGGPIKEGLEEKRIKKEATRQQVDEEIKEIGEKREIEEIEEKREIEIIKNYDGFEDLDPVIKKLNLLETGRTTRMKTSIIESLQNTLYFVYESKVFIIGFFCPEPYVDDVDIDDVAKNKDSKGGSSKGSRSSSSNGSRSSSSKGSRSSSSKSSNSTKSTYKKDKKSNITRKKKEKQNHKIFNDIVINGFNSAILDSESEELKKYFEFMKLLYLFYVNDRVHPLSVFNNIFITQAMVLYVIDKSVFLSEDGKIDSYKVHDILEYFMEEYGITPLPPSISTPSTPTYLSYLSPLFLKKKDKQSRKKNISNFTRSLSNISSRSTTRSHRNSQIKSPHHLHGGAPVTLHDLIEIKKDIQESCSELSDIKNISVIPVIEDGIVTNDFNFEKYQSISEKYHKIFKEYNKSTESDNKIIDIIKKLNNKKYETEIKNKKKIYDAFIEKLKNTSKRPRIIQQIRIYEEYINALKTFLMDIYNTIDEYLIHSEQRLNAVQSTDTLSIEQKNVVQEISRVVSIGVLKYIGLDSIVTGHLLLDRQNSILSKIAEKKRIGMADSDLLQGFIDYAGLRCLTTPEEIKGELAKNKQYRIINNAATKSFTELKLNESSVVCPNSSIVDAMGSFGSCSSLSDRKRETYTMEFLLTNDITGDYYIGQSIYKVENFEKELKVNYSARINGFQLPYVEKKIDMRNTSHITVLSANNTFKQVINKILSIWRGFTFTHNPTKNELWDIIYENEGLFIDLVSCGSLKSVGDLFQEINSTATNGGYISIDSKTKDKINTPTTVGAMGDQPSGVRAGFILLNAEKGTNPNSIAGYFGPPSETEVTKYAVISNIK